MASLQKVSTGHFHISFRMFGKRFKRSLKTRSEKRATTKRIRVEETIELIETGRLDIPDGIDVAQFVLNDGRFPSRPAVIVKASTGGTSDETSCSLSELFQKFFDQIPTGNLEESTLKGMHIHERHLMRLMGEIKDVSKLSQIDLQSYVNRRSQERTQSGTLVGPVTINKELVTLGTAWRWATTAGVFAGEFPRKGIRLPKADEAPPFQTWDEIERQIERERLDDAAASQLWDALYLRKMEIDEFINFTRTAARHPFIYPMIVMAAHTGARRSEIVRALRSDFDFTSKMVLIRERKRVRGRNSTRRVPMTNMLRTAMTEWFEHSHPGSPSAFAHCGGTRSAYGDAISKNEARSHFDNTFMGSKWEKVKGWHCLRHSFISNLASEGVDQRLIDDFVGHTTDEMRRRYRHLFPNTKLSALNRVFG